MKLVAACSLHFHSLYTRTNTNELLSTVVATTPNSTLDALYTAGKYRSIG
eukprot:COSAG03_NODE_288_length_9356_cov_6.131224_4_plen_50_part_00